MRTHSPRNANATRAVSPVPKVAAHAVHVSSDGLRSPIAAIHLQSLARMVLVAEKVPRAMVSITLVSSRDMARLNREHLGHRGPTDVITFALGDDGSGVLVADIYICPDVARQQAAEWNVGVRDEVARLVVHGVLHSCGWDHPVDETREGSPMWQRQERLLSRWRTSRSVRE
jgi:probable rRNA maturation factor